MEKDQIPDWMMEFIENVKKHQIDLPDTPDHILVILKGHLLVEQEINRLIEAKVANPNPLNLRGLYGPKFSHKVDLLEALILKPEPVELWELCRKLNKLRNDFGHRLSPNDVEKRMDKFTDDVYKVFAVTRMANIMENVLKKDQRDQVQKSIFYILYSLVCLLHPV